MGEWTNITLSNSTDSGWWTQESASGRRAAGIILKCDYRVNGKNMEYLFYAKDDKRINTIEIFVPRSGGTSVKKTAQANKDEEFTFVIPVADLKENANYREANKDVRCMISFDWWAADGSKVATKKSPGFFAPVMDEESEATFRCMENGLLIECEADGIEAAYLLENGELVEVGV